MIEVNINTHGSAAAARHVCTAAHDDLQVPRSEILLYDGQPMTLALYARRWGDSPLRYVQTLLFLNYTAETRQLDFIDYYHDKVTCRQSAVNEVQPVGLECVSHAAVRGFYLAEANAGACSLA